MLLRPFIATDTEALLQIWLEASCRSHDFIPASYWQNNLERMRTYYLPQASIIVAEQHGQVVGFYALCEEHLAALFVSITHQHQGIGTALLNHAKTESGRLTLQVYVQNQHACRFYRHHGFVVMAERLCNGTDCPELVMCWSRYPSGDINA
ncbi:MAG: GNAT family N-acetyltransferase [Aeromonas sp.]